MQGGITGFRTHPPDAGSERSSSDAVYVAHTGKGYTRASLQVERWSPDDRRRVRVRIAHASYPLPWFGNGADAPEAAEEWYSSAVTTTHVFVEPRLRAGLYGHAAVRVIHSRLRESEPGGALGESVYSSGSRVALVTLGLSHDTRDHPVAPRAGAWARIMASVSGAAIGSRYASRRLTIDARRYMPLGRSASVALHLQYDGIAGNLPFDQLPMIGADSAMRGYPVGRYRDRQAVTAQLEWRSGHWRRVGIVTFAGAGTVAARARGIANGPWFPTAGIGGRYLISPRARTALRADLGIGRGAFGVNFGVGDAF